MSTLEETQDLVANINSLTWGSWNEQPGAQHFGDPVTVHIAILNPGAWPSYYTVPNANIAALLGTPPPSITAVPQGAVLEAFAAWAAVANISYDMSAPADCSQTITLGIARLQGPSANSEAQNLLRKARLTRAAGATGAVTLIQRFGSALNLNVHFHMLFLDGTYLVHTRPPVFRCVAPPSDRELQALATSFSA
jgi:hypothetical protein